MADPISKVITDAYKNDGKITEAEINKIEKSLEGYRSSLSLPTGSSQFIQKHAETLPDCVVEWSRDSVYKDQLRLRLAAVQIATAVNNDGVINEKDDLSAVKALPFEVRGWGLTSKKAIPISTIVQDIRDQPFQARVGELVRVLNSEDRKNDTIRELAEKAQSPYFTANTDSLIPKLIEIIKEKCLANSDKAAPKCIQTKHDADLYEGIAILLSKATPEKAIQALEELTASSPENDDLTAFFTLWSPTKNGRNEPWDFKRVLQNCYAKIFTTQIEEAKTGEEPIFSTLEASLGDRTKSTTYQRVLWKTLSEKYLEILRYINNKNQLRVTNPLIVQLRREIIQCSEKSPEQRTLAWFVLSSLIRDFGNDIEEREIGWRTVQANLNSFESGNIDDLDKTDITHLPSLGHRIIIIDTSVGSDQSKALLKAELMEVRLHEPSLIIFESKGKTFNGKKASELVLSAIRRSYQLTEFKGDYFDSFLTTQKPKVDVGNTVSNNEDEIRSKQDEKVLRSYEEILKRNLREYHTPSNQYHSFKYRMPLIQYPPKNDIRNGFNSILKLLYDRK